jgi:hypothetical protein
MAKRGYKEWAKHLKKPGKRAAAKIARKSAKSSLQPWRVHDES